MRLGLGLVVGSLLSACIWGSGSPAAVERVDEVTIVEFAERIEGFYGALARRRVNALMTFEDPELRRYFAGEREFEDYYAALAEQVQSADFRHATPLDLRVEEFRFVEAERAEVDVLLVGKHLRAVRFWDLEIRRTDTWERLDGVWFLTPDRL